MRATTRLAIAGLFLFSGQAMALKPGSVVIYSDSSVEKLLSDDGSITTWEDGRKRTLTRSHNPVTPTLSRQDFLGGGGYALELIRGNPDELRDAPKGTYGEFTYLRTKNDGRVSERDWQCTAKGKSRRRIAGKKRALLNFHCKRMKHGSKFWATTVAEERTIRYSPRLNLVVDVKRKTRKGSSRRKVVAILSPKKATYARIDKHLDKLRSRKKKKK